MRFRLDEVKKELRKLDAAPACHPSWSHERQDIVEHVKDAEESFYDPTKVRTGIRPLEPVLRNVMAAERKLIPFLPAGRGIVAIADLRRDLLTYVSETRRAPLQLLLDQAKGVLLSTKAYASTELTTSTHSQSPPQDQAESSPDEATPPGTMIWWQYLLEAKIQVDEIVLRGYQNRERLRDSIATLGLLLLTVDVVLLITLPIVGGSFGVTGTSTTSGNTNEIAAGLAAWIGFLFGAVGACLSGLFTFTVHGIARGEYESSAATVIRPLIGGTSGILGAALAATGILNFQDDVLPGLALTAFILGFSERLVMGTVERLGARAEARLASAQ